jgi:peptide/nickel transport system substrate-binding protein
LNKKPLGTGPFRFLEWKTGAKTVFEANPDYFEDRPYLSRVITRVIPDMATTFLELKSGGIDMMGLTPLQYTRQTETAEFRKSFNKYRYLSFGYTYLGFRLSHPLFSDRRVRQAFAYAVHKKEKRRRSWRRRDGKTRTATESFRKKEGILSSRS